MGHDHKFLSLFLFSFFFLFSSVLSSSSLQPEINVWPKPRNLSWPNPQTALLSPTFQIHSPTHKHLQSAVDRYLHLIRSEHHQPIRPPSVNVTISTPLLTVNISVADLSIPLQHGVDESYSLSILTAGYANLTAETVWGAMRGLETFSQLVYQYGGGPLKIATGIYIWDRPLFPHRGLVLDTSRNYYGVKDLMRTIEAMSANKLNVFHWHITDSHSFPLVLPSEPELARKGSYGAGMQYTPSDVKSIVEFGMERGFSLIIPNEYPQNVWMVNSFEYINKWVTSKGEILLSNRSKRSSSDPEFSMVGINSGHTGSWAEAYPEIVTCANMFWMPPGSSWADRLAAEPGTGQLNPLSPKTYQVVQNVIRDLVSLFPDTFYHAGHDEIVPGCWKADPTVQDFLSKGGTLSQLLEIFVNATNPIITSLNRTSVYWEDVLLDSTIKVDPTSLPKASTILQTWNNGPNNTKLIVAAGYRTIVSSSDFYYLDCGHGDFVGNDSRYDRQIGDEPGQPFNYQGGSGGSWCGPYKTWQRVYDYDITYGLSEKEAELVVGGEVALWSEQADPAVMDGRIWPRASAMAETMWSGNRDESGKKRYAEATDRLNEWRYRMVGRGVGAEPIQPLWCLTRPTMCNLVQ
ncbi:Glycoside hydrolase family 20 [Cinnamomum micranthum f. kanehirae]|uniref:Beta-hexosaminidase n=1 Tax=Cinnamomum micranthum f. kanehirae TaxID=337451 RepID=A0A443NGQ1_9MAGN|nr:Glycoside hydrolase family 20 [Cinnamomum micranthum f. kanehirae]